MSQELKDNENYQQETVDYLVSYLHKKNRELKDFDYQLNSNSAFIYILDSKEVVLLPSNLSLTENGLLLKDEPTLKKIIQNDYFPIEVLESTPLEGYSEKFANLPENVHEYIDFLEKELNIEISTVEKFDDVFFDEFDNRIKDCDLENRQEEFLVPLIILLGELIIKNKTAYWKIKKEYSLYNPYYHPVIVMGDIELDVTDRILSDLEIPDLYSLKQSYQFLTDPRINPVLNPKLKDIYKDFLNNH